MIDASRHQLMSGVISSSDLVFYRWILLLSVPCASFLCDVSFVARMFIDYLIPVLRILVGEGSK